MNININNLGGWPPPESGCKYGDDLHPPPPAHSQPPRLVDPSCCSTWPPNVGPQFAHPLRQLAKKNSLASEQTGIVFSASNIPWHDPSPDHGSLRRRKSPMENLT